MNSKWHFILSLLKSAIRIGSGIYALCTRTWQHAVAGFVIAEVIGILEELGDKRG